MGVQVIGNGKRVVPTAPLIDYVSKAMPDASYEEKGMSIGATRDVWQRIVRKEYITLFTADKFAIALGQHPALIWKNWYEITGYERAEEVA